MRFMEASSEEAIEILTAPPNLPTKSSDVIMKLTNATSKAKATCLTPYLNGVHPTKGELQESTKSIAMGSMESRRLLICKV